MNKTTLGLLVILINIFSCSNNDNTPDVSKVEADVKVERFDRDFFAIDTNNLSVSLAPLWQKYPSLLPIFLASGIGVTDSTNLEIVKIYLRMNTSVYDSAQKVFPETKDLENELEQAFKYVKHYFPKYQVPNVYTIVGPIDLLAEQPHTGEQTTNFLGPDMLGINLQFYLGKDFSLYSHEYFVTNVAPLYRSRRFSKEYITADAMKLITDDIYPDKSAGRPLIEQMIEKGKQWWMLDKFMPKAHDSVKTGFTERQLEWISANEGEGWAYILQNENLYSIDPPVLQTYIGESPYTQTLSESSPGNSGPWFGWQIVRKFVEKNPDMSVSQVMETSAKQIWEQAKYKPK